MANSTKSNVAVNELVKTCSKTFSWGIFQYYRLYQAEFDCSNRLQSLKPENHSKMA